MALARCEKCGKPKGRTKTYVCSVRPVGYSDTAAICGIKDCENSAQIWLDENEVQDFLSGQDVFSFPNNAMKVRVIKVQ